jgi:tetratricopeptide (TPR) repeat protein
VSARGSLLGAIVAALALILLAAGVLRAREAAYPARSGTDRRLLYLRSGPMADRLALSFDAIVSDVYWIRAIQHFGRDRKSRRTTDRFELLQPLLDLTTSLDPHFNIAYRFGAVFLSLDPPDGPARPDQAIALLEKGLRANPRRWQYVFDIGFVHYWAERDYAAAAAAFDRAAAMPGAPEWLRPLAATARLESGDRPGARRLLTELARSEVAFIRQAAVRAIAQLDVIDFIEAVQARVEAYYAARGVYPGGWADLQREGYIRGVPRDSTGTPLVYDAATRTVTLSPSSPLSPLPRSFPPARPPVGR